jgi:hypothetical protein
MSKTETVSTVRITAKSWDEVWEHAREHEMTHYNYSRGLIRYHAVHDDPIEIGTPSQIKPGDTVRIRFYQEIDSEWVDDDSFDINLSLPDETAIDLFDDGNQLSPRQQTDHYLVQMHKIASVRWARQMDSAEKMTHAYIRSLESQITSLQKQNAELQKEIRQLWATRGVQNIYDFLIHPNGAEALAKVGVILGQSSGAFAEFAERIMRVKAEIDGKAADVPTGAQGKA